MKTLTEAIAELPPPMEAIIVDSPCNCCQFFQGLQFFGVPLICLLRHEGHNWNDTNCEYWTEAEW